MADKSMLKEKLNRLLIEDCLWYLYCLCKTSLVGCETNRRQLNDDKA